MAELIAAGTAIGVASSLVTFAEVAWRVLRRLDEYSDRTKDVPAIIKHIRPQLQVLAGKMEELKEAAKHGSLITSSQSALSKAVQSYEKQINLLDELTAKMLPNEGDPKRTIAKKAFLSVYYEKKLSKTWAELETYKTTFIFHFTNMKSDPTLMLDVKPLETHYHYPASISSRFVIRERPLQEMEDAMSDHKKPATPRVVVLLGMGGSGKTQLALRYCEQCEAKRRYTSIFWVDASSPAATAQSFVTIAGFITNNKVDLKDDEVVLQIVKSRISTWTDRWLIVFDNFDDPSAFASRDIKDYFPRGDNGAILFTSRHGDVKRLGHTITVAEMSESEGLELLFRQAGCDNSEENVHSGKEIITRLGNLALAIDQAGAYISARNLSLGLFMDHYNNRREKILRETPTFWEYKRRPNTAEAETSLSVFTTWEMSFEQIGRNNANERTEKHLLMLSAFFDNADIFEALFKRHFELEKPEWMNLFDTQGEWDSYEFQDVLARLGKISLIRSLEITTSGARFSLHPLVQDWIKLKLNAQDRQNKTMEAISILAEFINEPDVTKLTLQLKQTILSHLTASIRNEAKFVDHNNGLESESLLHTIDCFALFYREQCRLGEAEALYDRALAGREKALGRDHTSTLATVNNLGILYWNQGRLAEAEAMYDRALAGREKALGRDHTSTLETVNNLGILYWQQGRLAEAEAMYDRALAGTEKALGRDHTTTLETVNNLGLLYWNQGRLAEAEAMYDRALAGREKVLGYDHRTTSDTIYNLGLLYREQGNVAKAATQFERAALGYKKTLGPSHPETIDAEDQVKRTLIKASMNDASSEAST